ncbi:hypothetical protein U1Q18_050634 [Sarracenia purpurea var. burkii]
MASLRFANVFFTVLEGLTTAKPIRPVDTEIPKNILSTFRRKLSTVYFASLCEAATQPHHCHATSTFNSTRKYYTLISLQALQRGHSSRRTRVRKHTSPPNLVPRRNVCTFTAPSTSSPHQRHVLYAEAARRGGVWYGAKRAFSAYFFASRNRYTITYSFASGVRTLFLAAEEVRA